METQLPRIPTTIYPVVTNNSFVSDPVYLLQMDIQNLSK